MIRTVVDSGVRLVTVVGDERKREQEDAIFFIRKHLFFNFRSQPLNVLFPHVLHLDPKWTKWSIPELLSLVLNFPVFW